MKPRAWIAGLSALSLAATVAVVGVSTTSAVADTPTYTPAGTLSLITTSGTAGGDTWTYDRGTASTADDAAQPVVATTGTCTLSPASAAGPLVTLTALNGSPGFLTHQLGVTQGVTTTKCSKINSYKLNYVLKNETLSIALNNTSGALADPLFGATLASGATLDMGLGDDSKVRADTYLNGVKVGSFTLIGDEYQPSTLAPGTTFCRTPDDDDESHMIANCAWTIPGPNFDTLTLTSVTGSVSLQGGGAWGAAAASHRTTFSLVSPVDGTIDCDASKVASVIGTGGELTGTTVTRLSNGATNPDGTPVACVGLPYTLDSAASSVTFHKPDLPGQESAQFATSVTRTFAAAPNPVPAAGVDWEVTGESPLPLAYCKPGLITGLDASTLPTGVNYGLLNPLAVGSGGDDQSSASGLQYACIYAQDPVFDLATGSLTQTDFIYFTGDIKFTTR